MTQKRVVITGMGTVNPLAHNVADTWSAMLACRSALSRTELFDASTYPSTFSAQVKDFDLTDHIDSHQKHRHAGRHCRFALAAANEAWTQSRLAECANLDPARLGIYLGSGEGSLDFDNFISAIVDSWSDGHVDRRRWAELALARMDTYREVEQESNMVVAHLSALLGARGPAVNCLTACAASTQAIGEATMLIRHGDADAVITGGAHSMIHPLGLTGFNRLTALSVRNDEIETASRPFDLTRDGFVLGEGASILIRQTLGDRLHLRPRNSHPAERSGRDASGKGSFRRSRPESANLVHQGHDRAPDRRGGSDRVDYLRVGHSRRCPAGYDQLPPSGPRLRPGLHPQ